MEEAYHACAYLTCRLSGPRKCLSLEEVGLNPLEIVSVTRRVSAGKSHHDMAGRGYKYEQAGSIGKVLVESAGDAHVFLKKRGSYELSFKTMKCGWCIYPSESLVLYKELCQLKHEIASMTM